MSDHHGTLTGGLTIKHSSSAYSPRQITHWLSSISFPYPVSDDDIAQVQPITQWTSTPKVSITESRSSAKGPTASASTSSSSKCSVA
ncbi:hypothetical protein C0989_009564 [Termitomyces sp. Mn162]|nr:hypothetical protein C0989_009564 [Termitomyces sp. Mn162]